MALPKGMLKHFRLPTGVFVETGTHMGDGVQAALGAGFDSIHSCDISPFCYGYCTRRFEGCRDRVHLYLQDSRSFLRKILRHISSPTVFWLDAHWCAGDAGSAEDVPLMEELLVLAHHHIRDHVILIDDVRLMGTKDLNFPLVEVQKLLLKINPEYRLSFLNSRDFPRDILVATI